MYEIILTIVYAIPIALGVAIFLVLSFRQIDKLFDNERED